MTATTASGSKLNVPASWRRMEFFARMGYLVDTHQARDHKDARKILAALHKTTLKPTPAIARLPYGDN